MKRFQIAEWFGVSLITCAEGRDGYAAPSHQATSILYIALSQWTVDANAVLRKLHARTCEELWRAAGRAFSMFTQAERRSNLNAVDY